MAGQYPFALTACTVVAVLLGSASTNAGVLYSTSGASVSGLGDTLGTTFDQLVLSPFSGTINGSTFELNPFSFTVGINAHTPITPPPSALPLLSETLTIDGVTSTIFIPYSISIDRTDTLNVATGPFPLTFPGFNAPLMIVDGFVVTLVPGTVQASIGPGGTGTFSGGLFAQIAPIPEPATWTMMILGFAGLGLVGLRRKSAEALAKS